MPLAFTLLMTFALGSSDYATIMNEARFLEEVGKHAEAAERFADAGRATWDRDKSAEAFLASGRAHFAAGDKQKALIAFVVVLQAQPYRRLTDDDDPDIITLFGIARRFNGGSLSIAEPLYRAHENTGRTLSNEELERRRAALDARTAAQLRALEEEHERFMRRHRETMAELDASFRPPGFWCLGGSVCVGLVGAPCVGIPLANPRPQLGDTVFLATGATLVAAAALGVVMSLIYVIFPRHCCFAMVSLVKPQASDEDEGTLAEPQSTAMRY